MKKHVDFIVGMTCGFLFFFTSGYASGLYGLPLYDAILRVGFDMPENLLGTLAILSIPYILFCVLVFGLYRLIMSRARSEPNKTQGGFFRSFLRFLIGFYLALTAYIVIGLIGFLQGEFSL
ncbi:MAG: hypothetical protein A3C03_00085 [Candidatus Colwellbacteria bacterium RIFCSPHIGHO2_02_FULL_45_17]|uniref:Uncharacterized protein n=2 Tax=Candidatus Colwelliibacteriota TaxID=1817904 RepID=A0A1G1ZDC0_9BACT|nr:MAG: hypothetical protein A3C03_00085 [Candidatus Colwellbacteria bacterium RIFCSPHIGHO2_02_FULL_45_17]OGY61041.1 MAG: hypothetical protein A3I33_01320 [Candidatus Colwellbacteria bacterium RIFCSPLOWO2_02_FULL_45_11]OGY62611.1 MAG: hypothetical protein A3G58_00320 [Candidatus Colwellbacteria bacterium RIFCSPLOWO2_12_FULL_46_17]